MNNYRVTVYDPDNDPGGLQIDYNIQADRIDDAELLALKNTFEKYPHIKRLALWRNKDVPLIKTRPNVNSLVDWIQADEKRKDVHIS